MSSTHKNYHRELPRGCPVHFLWATFFILILTCLLAVILSGGGAAANGAFTQGSQSDGDTSNTTVSFFFLAEFNSDLFLLH